MNARHERIVAFLGGRGEASVQDLAEHFDVSLMTIRRDLALLERAGRLTRTHGGAVLSKPGVVEFAFVEKGERFAAEKRAIAREAARLVQPGMSVALDSGTTTLEVAKAIRSIDGITVLTSSLAIASVLYAQDNVELVLLGGTARKGSPDLTGWLTEENLKQFKVDLAIVGADGVTPDGAYTKAVDLTRVCQAVMAAGQRTILVLDHSKLGKTSFARFTTLNRIDHLITDAGAASPTRKWLSKAVSNITYAKV